VPKPVATHIVEDAWHNAMLSNSCDGWDHAARRAPPGDPHRAAVLVDGGDIR
jgi:hypothetical protein